MNIEKCQGGNIGHLENSGIRIDKERWGNLQCIIYPDNQLEIKIPFDGLRDKQGTQKNRKDSQIIKEEQIKKIIEKIGQSDVEIDSEYLSKKPISGKMIDIVGCKAGYGKLPQGSEFNGKKKRTIRRRVSAIDKEFRKSPEQVNSTLKVLQKEAKIELIESTSLIDKIFWENEDNYKGVKIDYKKDDQAHHLVEVPRGYEYKLQENVVIDGVSYDNSSIRLVTLTIPSNTQYGLWAGSAWSSYINKCLGDEIRNIANENLPVKFNVEIDTDKILELEISYSEYSALKGINAKLNYLLNRINDFRMNRNKWAANEKIAHIDLPLNELNYQDKNEYQDDKKLIENFKKGSISLLNKILNECTIYEQQNKTIKIKYEFPSEDFIEVIENIDKVSRSQTRKKMGKVIEKIKKNLPRLIIQKDGYDIDIKYDDHSDKFITGYQRVAVIKVMEYQARGMLHWHLVLGCNENKFFEVWDKEVRKVWYECLKQVNFWDRYRLLKEVIRQDGKENQIEIKWVINWVTEQINKGFIFSLLKSSIKLDALAMDIIKNWSEHIIIEKSKNQDTEIYKLSEQLKGYLSECQEFFDRLNYKDKQSVKIPFMTEFLNNCDGICISRKTIDGETTIINYSDENNREKIRIANEIPRKSVAAYLSKYLSKIDSKGYGTKDKFKINHWFTKQEIELAPCRWATYNKTSRQLLKKHTIIWQSPVKHRVPELINYAKKIASRLENNNLIKKKPVRVVRAKSQKNGINKGESYILMDKSLNENNPLISQRKSIDIPFNNYYESIWLKDENDVGVQGYLRKFNYADLHSYFDQEYYSYMCIRQLSDYSHKRVNNWLTQLDISSLSEYNNKLNEENNISEKSNYIENIIKDAVRNIANEKFTPDEMLDYVNNCLKATSISLYQLAHYFSLI